MYMCLYIELYGNAIIGLNPILSESLINAWIWSVILKKIIISLSI